jgi:hypothetical protein
VVLGIPLALTPNIGYYIMSVIYSNLTPVNRLIYLVTLMYAVVFATHVGPMWNMLSFMLTSPDAQWDFNIFISVLPLAYIPVALGLMLWKKKTGWVMSTIYLVNLCMATIYAALVGYRLGTSNPFLNSLFQVPPLSTSLMRALFYGALIFLLSKKEIRQAFRIDMRLFIICLGGMAVLTTIQWWNLLIR